ncbi:hypothetical protein BaRGS_00021655 [Batillaria attramentaria]|uniref:Secreted protein n=1 Tax=Batillaria attramentaria TaxID=370345 RepID=A0ABD0KJE6_9CAEN
MIWLYFSRSISLFISPFSVTVRAVSLLAPQPPIIVSHPVFYVIMTESLLKATMGSSGRPFDVTRCPGFVGSGCNKKCFGVFRHDLKSAAYVSQQGWMPRAVRSLYMLK